jgi:hypothetical protein
LAIQLAALPQDTLAAIRAWATSRPSVHVADGLSRFPELTNPVLDAILGGLVAQGELVRMEDAGAYAAVMSGTEEEVAGQLAELCVGTSLLLIALEFL